MSKRLYLGRLAPTATKQDIEDHFKGYRLTDVRLMGNFGFAEFESSRDAEDCVRDYNGRDFMGESLIVEPSRESRKRDVYEGYGRGPPPARGPARKGVRVTVIGIPHSTSWQDLKDYGRIGSNNVMYADVDRNNPGNGIIEYPTMAEAEEAITRLSGVDINNTPVKLEIAPDDGGAGGGYSRGPPPPRDYGYDRPRYDDRGPPRDSRPRYDDRRDDRGPPPPRRDYDRYDREPRRDYAPRDRSPPRRRDDDRYGGDRYAGSASGRGDDRGAPAY